MLVQIAIKTGIDFNILKTYDEKLIATFTELLFQPRKELPPGTFGA